MAAVQERHSEQKKSVTSFYANEPYIPRNNADDKDLEDSKNGDIIPPKKFHSRIEESKISDFDQESDVADSRPASQLDP